MAAFPNELGLKSHAPLLRTLRLWRGLKRQKACIVRKTYCLHGRFRDCDEIINQKTEIVVSTPYNKLRRITYGYSTHTLLEPIAIELLDLFLPILNL